MSDWKLKDKGVTSYDAAQEALTLGFAAAQTRYECTNEKTGEKKSVFAYSPKHAGEKISNGEFAKDRKK